MNNQTSTPNVQKSRLALGGALVYLIAFVSIFVCLVLVLGKYTLPALLFPAYFVVGLVVLTALTRTVPLRWVFGCFVMGAFLVALPTLLVSGLLSLPLDAESTFFTSVLVPIVEEALKIAPLLVLLALPRWRYRWTAGASDLLVLAAALGAGFAFYEDALVSYGYSADVLSVYEAAPHLGPLYPFPSMTVKVAMFGWNRSSGLDLPAFVGHGGATAFIGLAIGLARLLGARFRKKLGPLSRLLWIAPLLAWVWMVVEHGMYNYTGSTSDLPALLRIPYALGAYGRVSSYVLYLLVFATMGIEGWLLWRSRWRTVTLRFPRGGLQIVTGAGLAAIPLRLLALRGFLRERRALSYGLVFYHGEGGGDKRRAYLEQLARALLFWKARLQPPPPAAESG